MSGFSRRKFLKTAGVVPAASLASASILLSACDDRTGNNATKTETPAPAPEITTSNAGSARVVVIGGGFGGATAARYLRKFDPEINVTLIEPKQQFVTCPGSNWVLGGERTQSFITHRYDNLRDRHGVNVVHDRVTAIDPDARKVTLQGGATLAYDRLIVSPGIDFRANVEGYDAAAMEVMPHAWNGGPQTELLRKQLEAMPDGGTVILAPPPLPAGSAGARQHDCALPEEVQTEVQGADPRCQGQVLQAGVVHRGLEAALRLRHRQRDNRMGPGIQ
jgi:hypothetical protein